MQTDIFHQIQWEYFSALWKKFPALYLSILRSVCPKTFAKNGSCGPYYGVHAGRTPYKCTDYGRSCIRGTPSHPQSTHKNERQKSPSQDAFLRLSDLLNHKEIHTEEQLSMQSEWQSLQPQVCHGPLPALFTASSGAEVVPGLGAAWAPSFPRRNSVSLVPRVKDS